MADIVTTIINYPEQFKYIKGETFASNYTVPAVIGVIYLTLVAGGTYFMKSRSRYEARMVSLIHNFSACLAYHVLPNNFYIVSF